MGCAPPSELQDRCVKLEYVSPVLKLGHLSGQSVKKLLLFLKGTPSISSAGPIHFDTPRTLKYSLSENNEPFVDRLKIFSIATNPKNTLVVFILCECNTGSVPQKKK